MALSEQDAIQRYFRPLAGPEGLGLVDDAALLPPEPGFDWVITTDLVAEGIHFLDDPPEAIAAKALRVNLSDLAAKGAEPVGYTLALGLGDACDEAWIAGFAEGLAADQQRYGIRLIGGDTGRSGGGTVIAITAVGRVPVGEMVRRTTARAGDIVYVSGTIGDAALGVLARKGRAVGPSSSADHLLQRYLYPEPRVALAPVLRRHATAAMDVSDGLVGDLGKLCAASECSAEIEIAKVPLSVTARAALEAESDFLETILTGGDDYEILMTAAPDTEAGLLADAAKAEVSLAPIGRVTEGGTTPVFRDAAGQTMTFDQAAYDHFAGQARS